MITDEGGRIDYHESGAGPAVVMVPGSCSTGAAWRPVIEQWNGRFRCVTTSLLGYGGTTERRTTRDANIAQEVAIIEAVARRAGCPVHLVGHSFGGLVALAVALAGRVPLLSLTVVEAPAAEILSHVGEQRHYDAFRTMTGAYFQAYRDGDAGAVARMIDFYGGAGTFASWPQRVRDYAIETTAANILDWACAYGFPLLPDALAAVAVPSLIMWGGASHPAAKRANELLGRHLAVASTVEVAGAAHFAIATHAPAVAHAIASHIDRAVQTSKNCSSAR